MLMDITFPFLHKKHCYDARCAFMLRGGYCPLFHAAETVVRLIGLTLFFLLVMAIVKMYCFYLLLMNFRCDDENMTF